MSIEKQKKQKRIRIFDHPEIKELFDVLFDKLLEESGRGAILIAPAHVEDYLTELIEEVFPNEISKTNRNRLLKYPGAISSFSSKIELLYAFRFISKNLRDSLFTLKSVRNDAAHSSSKFELSELNEKMKEVYNLGPNVSTVIKNMATELIVGSKVASLNVIFDEYNYSEKDKRKVLIEIFEDEDKIKVINEQLPHWELIVGLCFICSLIINSRERISSLTKEINTWDDLLSE